MFQQPGNVRPSCWIQASAGNIPPNAVVGGNDSNGETLFVGRAWYDQVQNFIPGKIVRSHGVCYIPYGGKEIGINNYEVLVQNPHVVFDWLPAQNGQIPAGSIMGNRKPDGQSDFIGRTYHEGGNIPGKVHVENKKLYFPYGGQELQSKSYEVLVCRMIDI